MIHANGVFTIKWHLRTWRQCKLSRGTDTVEEVRERSCIDWLSSAPSRGPWRRLALKQTLAGLRGAAYQKSLSDGNTGLKFILSSELRTDWAPRTAPSETDIRVHASGCRSYRCGCVGEELGCHGFGWRWVLGWKVARMWVMVSGCM